MTNPASCPPGVTNSSQLFVGAAYRTCNPATDITPMSASQQLTIADVVAGIPDLSILQSALNSSNIQGSFNVSQLSDPNANLTLFAPTNDAWFSFFNVEGLEGPQNFSTYSNLLPVLLLHLVNGRYDLNALGQQQLVTSIPTLSPSLFSNISVSFLSRLRRTGGLGGVNVVQVSTPASLSFRFACCVA